MSLLKFLPMIWVNLRRSPVRLALTTMSIVAAFAVFGVFAVLNARLNISASMNSLLLIAAVKNGMPPTHIDQVRGSRGVSAATGSLGLMAYGVKANDQQLILGFERDHFFAVFSPTKIDLSAKRHWLENKTTAFCDEPTAARWGWKVGQTVPLRLFDGQMQYGPGTTLEFVLEGIYPKLPELPSAIIARADYLNASSEIFRPWTIYARVSEPRNAKSIATTIDSMFKTSLSRTRTAPMSNYAEQGTADARQLQSIFVAALISSFLTMMLIVTNSAAHSIRQRINELAVLNAVGYQRSALIGIVAAETGVVFIGGATLGLALSAAGAALGLYSATVASVVSVKTLLMSLFLIVAFSLVAVAIPAWEIWRMRIATAIRG